MLKRDTEHALLTADYKKDGRYEVQSYSRESQIEETYVFLKGLFSVYVICSVEHTVDVNEDDGNSLVRETAEGSIAISFRGGSRLTLKVTGCI